MTHGEVRGVPHDPDWAEAFEAEPAALRSILGDEALAVHHIGSTSVPDLAAKPTVDVLVEVRRIGEIDGFDAAMAESGYEAWGEYAIPGRRFFVKNWGPVRTHNIHACEAGNPEVERHLVFRDYLIQQSEKANAYGTLKKTLAEKFPADIEAYMAGKDAFVKRTERGGGSPEAAPETRQSEMLKARVAGPKRAESGGSRSGPERAESGSRRAKRAESVGVSRSVLTC